MFVITVQKIVAIVCLVVLIGIVLLFSIIYWVRKQGENVQKKMWGIGKYDERENRNNRTFLVGKGDRRGEE